MRRLSANPLYAAQTVRQSPVLPDYHTPSSLASLANLTGLVKEQGAALGLGKARFHHRRRAPHVLPLQLQRVLLHELSRQHPVSF